MSEVIKEKTKLLNFKLWKVIVGLIGVLSGSLGFVYKNNSDKSKNNKYLGLYSALSIIFGSALLITELETNFKPVDEEDDLDE